jgi:hypothetical protein
MTYSLEGCRSIQLSYRTWMGAKIKNVCETIANSFYKLQVAFSLVKESIDPSGKQYINVVNFDSIL